MTMTGSNEMATTLLVDVPDGPVHSASVGAPVTAGRTTDPFRYRPLLAVTAVVALLVAGLIIVAVSRSGDDALGSASLTTAISNTEAPQSDIVSETTVPAEPTNVPPTIPPTIAEPVVEPVDEVDAARADFAAFIAGLPGAELTGNESKKVVEEVDEALAQYAAGELDEAQRLLERAFERLDEIESDDAAEGAQLRLERLAQAIGLDAN